MNNNKTVLSRDQAKEFVQWLQDFLSTQRVLVMATASDNSPYCNLMSFACTNNCSIIVITPRDTSKYANLVQNDQVSLLITDSSGEQSETVNNTAITINGRAKEIEAGSTRKELEDIYMAKYPQLKDFVQSETSALFRIDPVLIVSPDDFYRVKEVHFE